MIILANQCFICFQINSGCIRQKIWSWISYTAFKILTTCELIILPSPGQAPKTAPVWLSRSLLTVTASGKQSLHFTGKETECRLGLNPGLLPKYHFTATCYLFFYLEKPLPYWFLYERS